jgi:hypothetical protein
LYALAGKLLAANASDDQIRPTGPESLDEFRGQLITGWLTGYDKDPEGFHDCVST